MIQIKNVLINESQLSYIAIVERETEHIQGVMDILKIKMIDGDEHIIYCASETEARELLEKVADDMDKFLMIRGLMSK